MSETPPNARIANTVRTARTRKIVIRAAAEAFDRTGYLGTSLSDIVSRTGMTKGAVYAHFRSKDDLAVEVVRAQYARWPDIVDRIVKRHPDPLERLRALSYEVAKQFRHDVVVRAGIRIAGERDNVSAELPKPYVGWEQRIEQIVHEGQESGAIRRDIDAHGASRVIVAAFFGMQHVSNVLNDRRDLKRRLDEMWALLMPTLKP